MQKTQLQHCYVNRMGLLLFNPISICSQFRNLLFPSIQCWAHLEMCVQVSLTNSILWLRLTIAYVTGFLYARCFLNICIFFGLERGREGCFGLFVFVCLFFPQREQNKTRHYIHCRKILHKNWPGMQSLYQRVSSYNCLNYSHPNPSQKWVAFLPSPCYLESNTKN